jgi:hypothetical protein
LGLGYLGFKNPIITFEFFCHNFNNLFIMGKGDNKKRKIKKTTAVSNQKNEVATADKKRRAKKRPSNNKIFYGKENYTIIGVGLAVVVIGLLLMSGGNNAPDVWDVNEIYNWRRITLAPFVILCGLTVVIFAIFKSSDVDVISDENNEA